jgi:hypothetical protein
MGIEQKALGLVIRLVSRVLLMEVPEAHTQV